MKKHLLTIIVVALICSYIHAQPRIAVLDFNAGVGIQQTDVNGLSAIFNTHFTPKGYALVERTRVQRILEEYKIQVSSMTEEQRVNLGKILNVSIIIIGDVNCTLQQYNVDVRAVNVETGEIIAKDGEEFDPNTSYRNTMRTLAERMSNNFPMPEPEVIPEPEPKPEPEPMIVDKPVPPSPVAADPLYRPTGGSIRFLVGRSDIFLSMAYNYQITSGFLLGGGAGFGTGRCYRHSSWNNNTEIDHCECFPVFLETELRTPRYKWSFFVNAKVGYCIFFNKRKDYFNGSYESFDYKPIFANFTIGGSYKNINLGGGISTMGLEREKVALTVSFSYNLPLRSVRKAFNSVHKALY